MFLPRPRLRPLGLLVLALHALLGLALHQALRPAAPRPAAATPVHVWISRANAPPPAKPTRMPPAGADRPSRTRATPQADPTPPAAATAVPATETQAITAPPAAAAAPIHTGSAPLNLALPGRPASAPPAAWAQHDPRASTAPLNAEQRMARTLGTDTTLRTVQHGDGMELRRGNGCVQVQPSRAGQILPADSSAPRPSLVGNC